MKRSLTANRIRRSGMSSSGKPARERNRRTRLFDPTAEETAARPVRCLADWRRERVERTAFDMELAHLGEYIRYLQRPGLMIRMNLVAGLFRGLGMAVGFTILGAAVVYFLQQLAYRNLPVIGGFIAEIIRIVNLQQGH
jgi:hypothetical protein